MKEYLKESNAFKEYLKESKNAYPQDRANASKKKLNNLLFKKISEGNNNNDSKNNNNDNDDSEDNQISNFVDEVLKKVSKEILIMIIKK